MTFLKKCTTTKIKSNLLKVGYFENIRDNATVINCGEQMLSYNGINQPPCVFKIAYFNEHIKNLIRVIIIF